MQDLDRLFAEELAQLVQCGLVAIEADDEGAVPRFRPTSTSRSAADDDDPGAGLADLIQAALDRGEEVDVLVDALILARLDEESC